MIPRGPWRALALLAAAVLVLVALDRWLQHRRVARRELTAALRPLVDPALQIVPERVRLIRIQSADASHQWVYQWDGRAWRLPVLHGAYAATDRVDFLLKALLQTYGTVVSVDADDHRRFGVGTRQAPQVTLQGSGAEDLLVALLGRGAPDNRGAEAYARRAGNDTVLHLHANPAPALAGATPMLDPHVLPRALARRALVEVSFQAPGTGTPARLQRVDVLPDLRTPGPPGPGSSYAWVLYRAGLPSRGLPDTCDASSVGAYLTHLSRLQYLAVLPPRGDYGFGSGPSLALVDEEGTADRLVLGARRNGDQGFLHHSSAGLTLAVSGAALDLLLPAADLLLEPLPEPSPYEAQ